ncbi:MAG: hypothetical protein KDA20_12780 [Phycisphaerales bacterium]|nr:hypothetical protein [Phycisphaerales bacterium]
MSAHPSIKLPVACEADLPVLASVESASDLADHLLKLYESMASTWHVMDAQQNRIVIAAAGVMLAVPAFFLRAEVHLPSWGSYLLAFVELLLGLYATWVVETRGEHMKWVCRAVVRIEATLGYFTPGAVAATATIPKMIHDSEATLLPRDGTQWGNGSWLQIDHIRAIFLLTTAVIAAVFMLSPLVPG